jgi:hypothetical protein
VVDLVPIIDRRNERSQVRDAEINNIRKVYPGDRLVFRQDVAVYDLYQVFEPRIFDFRVRCAQDWYAFLSSYRLF